MTMCFLLIENNGSAAKRCGKINFNVALDSNNYFKRVTPIYSPHDWNTNDEDIFWIGTKHTGSLDEPVIYNILKDGAA